MKSMLFRSGASLAAAVVLVLAACGGGGGGGAPTGGAATTSSSPQPAAAPDANLSAKAQVGAKIFFDQNLSGSGKMSCATCHDPDHAYGPPNDLAVQLGGADLATPGTRAVPSLRYKDFTPAYADLLDNPDGISAPGPGGGFTWDGRAATLADQAQIPLLAANEMANASIADVAAKLRQSSYTDQFRAAFGGNALDDDTSAFHDALQALERYQREDPSFHPYTSKFDRYAANKIGGDFTAAEKRGMAVFTDPKRGNCASCHYQGAGLNGSSGLFTDFSYEAIGVPRNMAIPANQDPGYYDLGICNRTDHAPASPGAADTSCGMFKTPTLRNVATRTTFFHNGALHSLEQVVRFYNTRDTQPQLWYPTVNGVVQKFDDLPPAYRANVDRQMPMDGRAPGSANPMSEQDLQDLLCFLHTLTDGYQPPAVAPASGPCVD